MSNDMQCSLEVMNVGVILSTDRQMLASCAVVHAEPDAELKHARSTIRGGSGRHKRDYVRRPSGQARREIVHVGREQVAVHVVGGLD